MQNLNDIIEQYLGKIAEDAWVLIYKHNEIILDKLNLLNNERKMTPLNMIKECRIFSEHSEIKIWNYQNKTLHRICTDSDNQYNEYVEEMILWGNKIKDDKLIEVGRGCEIKFPFSIDNKSKENNKNKLPFKLIVKNLYQFDENGLIMFKDARLVKIVDHNNQEVKNG